MKLKIYVRYNDYTKTHYYRFFDVIDYYPDTTSDDVEEIKKDIEQGNSDAHGYDCFCIRSINEDFEPEYDDDGSIINEDDKYYYDYVCYNANEALNALDELAITLVNQGLTLEQIEAELLDYAKNELGIMSDYDANNFVQSSLGQIEV